MVGTAQRLAPEGHVDVRERTLNPKDQAQKQANVVARAKVNSSKRVRSVSGVARVGGSKN